ncbi:S8 family peptidase [Streptomyces sp. NPDC087844]|uniref:S8 family peptidase n=1 Tax=Streptomyces sp. NPDC087844 TaxID=3365805 RepID=UPI00382296F7
MSLTTAAAVAVAAGAVLVQAESASGHPEFGGVGSGARPSGELGGQGTAVTLVTGDTVTVDGKGAVVRVDAAEGREDIPVKVERANGHAFVFPLDAAQLVSKGIVDRRLFDVTMLSGPEYRDRARKGLGLIVAYRGSRPAARAAVRDIGGTQVRRSFERLNADALVTPARNAAKMWDALIGTPAAGRATAAAGVGKVWLDAVHKVALDKSVAQIGAPKAWAAGYDGRGVKIAVLDTGVDQTHPDLTGQEVAEKNFTDSATMADKVGHGTHVASTIAGTGAKSAGKYKGVASGARLLDGKILGDDGYGSDSGTIAGMEWAVAQGAKIVNMSVGGPDGEGVDPVEETVNRLSAQSGALFVVAAGNDGEAGDSTLNSPGTADAALTVGAVDAKEQLADFSSRGPRIGDGGIKPDLTAPGVDITAAAAPGSSIAADSPSPAAGYVTISGTSMATPHVAGAAAILAQEHPEWTGAQLKAALAASTDPGDLTVFEQGSGRVDVAAAIKQAVVAEPTSLTYATQSWPHSDDRPEARTVTYRNLGTRDITVALQPTFTGPEGDAAPTGFFTLDKKTLTVPAGGTAAATLTVHTKGGTLDGSYSGYVVATGGGQTVRTPAAVEREIEKYTLTIKHLGRDGRPTPAHETSMTGLTGPAGDLGVRLEPYGESGTATVRVPKGRYGLNSSIYTGSAEAPTGVDWIVRPDLTITKDTVLTLDARTAKPVSLGVPDFRAAQHSATASYAVNIDGETATDSRWELKNFKGFRVAHSGPKTKAGELHQQFQGSWVHGAGTEYNLAYGSNPTAFANGFARRARTKDLAKVTTTVGAPASGKYGELVFTPVTPGDSAAFPKAVTVKLPTVRTVYVNTAGVRWDVNLYQYDGSTPPDPDEEEAGEARYWLATQNFKAGKSYKRKLNVGVFGPKTGGDYGIFRYDNNIQAYLPLVADGVGNEGTSAPYDTAITTLYRNGVKIASNQQAVQGGLLTVPSGKADYRLTTALTRSKVSGVSTKVTAAWTFSSTKVPDYTRLPASVVRFTPALSSRSTAKAKARMRIPVAVTGTGAGKNLKSLAVSVSYNGGKTWRKTTVKSGAFTVRNPTAGKGISLRATARDKQGNTVTQTIINAYRGA